MPAKLPTKSRAVGVYRGSTPALIASVRTKSLTINGTPIPITTDDDDAVRKLLDEPGEVTVTITVEGVFKDETLVQKALETGSRVETTEFRWPGDTTEGKIAGPFFYESLEITGTSPQGETTFSATFQSSGGCTVTAAT